jgi:hypothetical protein
VQKILFNGCSQTEVGNLDYLENWQERTWAHLLAKKLNCKYTNLAITLSDNSRIFSTTLNQILKDKPDAIIIGWTDANRKQLPLENGDMVRLSPGCCISDNETDVYKLDEHWYKVHQNEWLSAIETLEYMVALKIICDNYKINLYSFNAINTNDTKRLIGSSFNSRMKRRAFRLKQDIEKFERLHEITEKISWLLPRSQSLLSYCKDNELSMDQWGHPEIDAQQHIADYFADRINKEGM